MKHLISVKNDLSDLQRIITNSTDGAYLNVECIEYKKEEQTVILKFTNCGKRLSNSLGSSTKWLIVRRIKKINTLMLKPYVLKEIQVLFGVQFRKGAIYLSSVEEERGETIFQMTIEVDKYDFDFQ